LPATSGARKGAVRTPVRFGVGGCRIGSGSAVLYNNARAGP
jgi:hypothetical protein